MPRGLSCLDGTLWSLCQVQKLCLAFNDSAFQRVAGPAEQSGCVFCTRVPSSLLAKRQLLCEEDVPARVPGKSEGGMCE